MFLWSFLFLGHSAAFGVMLVLKRGELNIIFTTERSFFYFLSLTFVKGITLGILEVYLEEVSRSKKNIMTEKSIEFYLLCFE